MRVLQAAVARSLGIGIEERDESFASGAQVELFDAQLVARRQVVGRVPQDAPVHAIPTVERSFKLRVLISSSIKKKKKKKKKK